MKNKNIILGSLALAFALSSAFSSILNEDLSQTVWVKVKQFASQQNFTCECVSLPQGTCNEIGTSDCSVIIQKSPSGTEGTVAHIDSSCTTRYKDNLANTDDYQLCASWNPEVVF